MRKEEFIEKAIAVHGDYYNYKNVPDIILENDTMIPIICPEHGLFYQSVYQHLKGTGCMPCKLKEY